MKLRQTNYRIEGLATFQVDSQIIPSISGVLFLCWLPASFSCFARRQIIQYYTYYIFIYIHTYTLWHLFCYAAFCLSLSTCICLSIKVFSQLTHTHTSQLTSHAVTKTHANTFHALQIHVISLNLYLDATQCCHYLVICCI